MFQREVAHRIIANCNEKKYGRISILTNSRLDVQFHFNISKKIIIFIILLIKSTITRVFFAPSVDNWKQYTSQWDYDLGDYKKNRKYKYLFKSPYILAYFIKMLVFKKLKEI